MDLVYPLFLIAVALIGFFLAHHIYTKKKTQDTLVCPLDSNCDAVIHSKHSTLAGVHLEVWGMLYYGFMALGYAYALIIDHELKPYLSLVLLSISTLAFFFSIYLTAIQAFIIHEWCTWCLMSAGLCIILFTTGVISAPVPIIDLLVIIFKF